MVSTANKYNRIGINMKKKYTGIHWNVTIPLVLGLIMITFVLITFKYGMDNGKLNSVGWLTNSIALVAAIIYTAIFRRISIYDEKTRS